MNVYYAIFVLKLLSIKVFKNCLRGQETNLIYYRTICGNGFVNNIRRKIFQKLFKLPNYLLLGRFGKFAINLMSGGAILKGGAKQIILIRKKILSSLKVNLIFSAFITRHCF